MQCRDVEQLIEAHGLSPLPDGVRGHLSGCASCATFVADLQSIVLAAHELPAEVEPPPRVWVALRAQLEAEKIIRDPEVVAHQERPRFWQGLAWIFSGRALAAAALALLVFAAGYLQYGHKSPAAGTPENSAAVVEPFSQADATLDQEERSLGPMQQASLGSDSQADQALKQNLATLNAFIKDCRQRLKEDPHDQVARDYLSAAYQQKAEILAAMMERGRSVN
jgi:hypothetical protein